MAAAVDVNNFSSKNQLKMLDNLPKNVNGIRTTHTCELCGFEPKTKNKYREKQDHLVMKHFKEKIDKIFPHCRPYACPQPECGFTGKDKQALLRHYTGKHGILGRYLREALAEKGIEYSPSESGKRKHVLTTQNTNGNSATAAVYEPLSAKIPRLTLSPAPVQALLEDKKPVLVQQLIQQQQTPMPPPMPRQNNEDLRKEVAAMMASFQPLKPGPEEDQGVVLSLPVSTGVPISSAHVIGGGGQQTNAPITTFPSILATAPLTTTSAVAASSTMINGTLVAPLPANSVTTNGGVVINGGGGGVRTNLHIKSEPSSGVSSSSSAAAAAALPNGIVSTNGGTILNCVPKLENGGVVRKVAAIKKKNNANNARAVAAISKQQQQQQLNGSLNGVTSAATSALPTIVLSAVANATAASAVARAQEQMAQQQHQQQHQQHHQSNGGAGTIIITNNGHAALLNGTASFNTGGTTTLTVNGGGPPNPPMVTGPGEKQNNHVPTINVDGSPAPPPSSSPMSVSQSSSSAAARTPMSLMSGGGIIPIEVITSSGPVTNGTPTIVNTGSEEVIKSIVENEDVMWSAGNGGGGGQITVHTNGIPASCHAEAVVGPAVVVEAANTVPVTYIETTDVSNFSSANMENVEFDFLYGGSAAPTTVNGHHGNAHVVGVSSHNNVIEGVGGVREKTLDFCML